MPSKARRVLDAHCRQKILRAIRLHQLQHRLHPAQGANHGIRLQLGSARRHAQRVRLVFVDRLNSLTRAFHFDNQRRVRSVLLNLFSNRHAGQIFQTVQHAANPRIQPFIAKLRSSNRK